MDINTFLTQLLGMPPLDFLVFFILALLGLSFSLGLEAYKGNTDMSEQKIKEWVGYTRNILRLVIAVMAVIVGLIFSEQYLGATLTRPLAFMCGAGVDRIIDVFLNKNRNPE